MVDLHVLEPLDLPQRDRIPGERPESHGVRKPGEISLGCCQSNRVQVNLAKGTSCKRDGSAGDEG
jgi:hypothetical protein